MKWASGKGRGENPIFGIRHRSGVLRTGNRWGKTRLAPRVQLLRTHVRGSRAVGVLLFDPLYELFGRGHGGEATLANESPVVEEAGGLDVFEAYGRVNAAAEPEIGYPELGVFGVRPGVLDHVSNPDNCGITHAVIDENYVAGFHFFDGAEGLWISHTVPNGLPFTLESVDRVRFGVGFG